MLAVKAFFIWLVMLVCAALNGALRELVLLDILPRAAALAASGILLCALILAVAMLLLPRLGPLTRAQAALIGLMWAGLTLVFELGYGRLVQQRGWAELSQAYTFQDGNLWPVVLLVTLLAPLLAQRLRRARA